MPAKMDFVDATIRDLARELPDLDAGALGAGERILRLAGSLRRRLDAALAPTGIRFAGFGVLAALRRAGEPYQLRPSDLSRQTLLTSGAMTNRIDRLEAAGLVERRGRSGEDRRTVLIRLTAAGRKRIEAAYPLYLAELDRLTAGIGAGGLRGLERGLRSASLAAGDVPPDAGSD